MKGLDDGFIYGDYKVRFDNGKAYSLFACIFPPKYTIMTWHASVAQLVEQLIRNQ